MSDNVFQLNGEELMLVDTACDAVTKLAQLIDDLSDRSLESYRPYTDYFDGIKHQCKKIIAGLDKLEDRLARTDREEILTVLRG